MSFLDHGHPGSLETLRPLLDAKLNLLTFLQAPVTVRLDGGVMYKNIRPTLTLNETVTLARIEPFDCSNYTIVHFKTSPYVELKND
jgi:hypothetical protein